MGKELEELSMRLEDAGSSMMAQTELNKRKEAELNRQVGLLFKYSDIFKQ